jgi:hypothetical protein
MCRGVDAAGFPLVASGALSREGLMRWLQAAMGVLALMMMSGCPSEFGTHPQDLLGPGALGRMPRPQ